MNSDIIYLIQKLIVQHNYQQTKKRYIGITYPLKCHHTQVLLCSNIKKKLIQKVWESLLSLHRDECSTKNNVK